jgi:hypothetical protein
MPRLYTLSPSEKNYTQIQGENGGGILDSGDITSINQRISPPENAEIVHKYLRVELVKLLT